MSIGTVDRFLKLVRERSGANTAKMCRIVLSGMLGMAARHDAIDRNPVRDTGPISVKPKNRPTSLGVDEVRLLIAKVTAETKAAERDLPEFIRFMVATVLRVGEAAAITWACVDFELGTVRVNGTGIRIEGEGVRIKPGPKSKARQAHPRATVVGHCHAEGSARSEYVSEPRAG